MEKRLENSSVTLDQTDENLTQVPQANGVDISESSSQNYLKSKLVNLPKFRAKELGTNVWRYGYFVRQKYVSMIYSQPDLDKEIGSQYLVDPNTLCQFTGLFDKFGNEIYEHDLVKTKYGRVCEVYFFNNCVNYVGVDLKPIDCEGQAPDKFDLFKAENLQLIGTTF